MDVVALQAAKAYADRRVGYTRSGLLPAPPATVRPWRPNSFSALTGVTFQRIYRLGTDAGSLRFVFINFAPQGSPNENSVAAFTIKADLVWYYTTGQATNVPILFNGIQSVTIPTYGILISDPVDVPFDVAVGSSFPVHTYVTGGTGTFLPNAQTESTGTYDGFNEGHLSGDFTGTTNSYGGATRRQESYGPVCAIGWPSSGRAGGAFLTGDSIVAGTGWPWEDGGANSFLNYACAQANIPAINMARSGETIAVASSWLSNRYRTALASACRTAISNYGTNDLGAGAATIKANLLKYWKALKRRGCNVYQCTIIPKTNSTDGWQTVSGQSAASSETDRQAVNQWLRAPVSAGAGNSALYDAGGALAGVFDTAATMEVNSNGSAIAINPATGAISNGSGGYTVVDTTNYASGTASATASLTLTDSTKAWATNQWLGYSVCITADPTTPASVGQARLITSNTATQLQSDQAWTTTPSASATYRIAKVYSFDGTHPTSLGHRRMAGAISPALLA